MTEPVDTRVERFGSFDRGVDVRSDVLGSDYVRNALGVGEPSALQRLMTETAWGGVWARQELPRCSRSLITLGVLIALNRPHEVRVHAVGALRNGLTPEEIREVVLHCAIYAGVPAAVDAMRIVDEVLAEQDGEVG